MDDFVRSLLLVLCGIGAIVALAVTYLWYFVFGKSLRAVLMAGLSIMMNRDSKIDLEDDPEVIKRPMDVKKEMTQETEALDFQSSLASHDEYIPQIEVNETDGFGAQAVELQRHTQELVSSSFEEGRFKRLSKALSRVFLRQRLSTESDVTAENVNQGTDSSRAE